jgi:elongation factor Ts
MSISADKVKAFRDKTGLPMMDCKEALVACEGNEDKALEWLRQKGKGRVAKMESREASEGRVACFLGPAGAGIVELRCETAPVAKTDDFMNLSAMLSKVAAGLTNPTPESLGAAKSPDNPARTITDEMHEVFNRLRENLQIKRVAKLSGHVGSYVHHNGQVGVIIEMSEPCADGVKADVCMHIAAMRPQCTRREEVAADQVEKERAVFAAEAVGKPPPVVEKMVEGKLSRWFSEFVLLDQAFVKDDKKSVGAYLKSVSPNLSVNRFVRFQVGG